MVKYAGRRLILAVPTILGVSILAFSIAHLAPGDAAQVYLRRVLDHEPRPEQIRDVRAELGLDHPLPVQYANWVGDAAQGNLGLSYVSKRPVTEELSRRIPATLQLAGPAAALALMIAFPVGIVAAVRRNQIADQLARLLCLAAASIPGFWLAIMLMTVFAVELSLVPVAGRGGWTSLILPVIVLALGPAAVLARFIRSTLLEVLDAEYIRAAKSRGLGPLRLLWPHAVRNSLIPVVTAFALSLGHLLTGTMVIESIFVWPGLGTLALDAISERDYPILQGFVLYAGLAFVVINLMVDISYGLIDPRIRVNRSLAGR